MSLLFRRVQFPQKPRSRVHLKQKRAARLKPFAAHLYSTSRGSQDSRRHASAVRLYSETRLAVNQFPVGIQLFQLPAFRLTLNAISVYLSGFPPTTDLRIGETKPWCMDAIHQCYSPPLSGSSPKGAYSFLSEQPGAASRCPWQAFRLQALKVLETASAAVSLGSSVTASPPLPTWSRRP